jgi:DNA-binding NtrC family response regulator
MANLLIIDDDLDFTRRLACGLQSDHTVTCLDEADAAVLERLAGGEFAAVLLDNHLPKMSGLEFLQLLEERGVTVPVILVTYDSDLKTTIDALDRGAFDYVQKRPMEELLRELRPLLARALEIFSQGPPIAVSGSVTPDQPCTCPQLICPSPEMATVRRQIAKATKKAQPVLILGEAGTGKDLVARAIWANGSRRDKPFVVVRCHTFDDDSLRDELFGHEIGFRGEGKLRKGKIEHASGGTLYLDDVGALPRTLQDDLLRVLEDRQLTRLGDNEPIAVDVRVIAASRCNLRSLPESKFRRELLGHLSSQTIVLPSLRHRTADLEPLVNHFLRQEATLAGKKRVPTLSAECWNTLRDHAWPGNVREMQNVICKAVVGCRGPQILARDLVFDQPEGETQILAGLRLAISNALSSHQGQLYGLLLDMLRKELVTLALEEYKGNAREVETRLGVSLDQLRNPDEQRCDDEPPTEKLPKAVERRIRALVLIQTYPAWTVVQYANKLGCSKSTLEKDRLIKRALELRKDDLRLPHGYINRNGTLDAYSSHAHTDFDDD